MDIVGTDATLKNSAVQVIYKIGICLLFQLDWIHTLSDYTVVDYFLETITVCNSSDFNQAPFP